MINILFVGNLTKSKGIDDLVNVFKDLRNHSKNISLTVCGDGPLLHVLNSEGINYKGQVNYSELPSIYKNADIFVSVPKDVKFLGIKIWEEYFSYTLMEAQAAGLPIIATNCGGILEEVDHKNYIIPQGDRGALKIALQGLILDSTKRFELGKINRKRSEKLFDSRIQAKKTEEVIIKTLIND